MLCVLSFNTHPAVVHPPNVTWNYTSAQGMDSPNSDNYTVVITLAEVQLDVLYSVNITPAALSALIIRPLTLRFPTTVLIM